MKQIIYTLSKSQKFVKNTKKFFKTIQTKFAQLADKGFRCYFFTPLRVWQPGND